MDITHLVVVMVSYHHRDEDESDAALLFFQNLLYDFSDCDDTWEGDVTGTPEVCGKEVQCGDYRGSW